MDFVEKIYYGLAGFFRFISDTLSDIATVTSYTGSVLKHIPDFFSWLPEVAVSIIVVFVGVVAFYKLFGRT